ncbi:MAG: hypothetical protein EOP10_27480 [Proteobacteria bacterium]|nr:MAG: hypothetical protein EOP10_27480 [Pseudomonadota bacterium]
MPNLPCALAMLFHCFPFPESHDRSFLDRIPEAESFSASDLFSQLPPGVDVQPREKIFSEWFAAGHVPRHLLQFKPIQVFERGHHLIYWVMPDYLSLGNDSDFVHTPLTWTATRDLAAHWEFLVPTAKMVDQIYQQSTRVHWPHAYPPSEEMRSTAYFVDHSRWIAARTSLEWVDHPLIAGHKKDLVVTPRLLSKKTKLAIYGWHNLGNGAAIQPLSLWHGQFYVDYSHGIRFVAPLAELDGKPVKMSAVLADPQLAPLVSFEGAFDICAVLGYVCS